jgi:hypothetical protein
MYNIISIFVLFFVLLYFVSRRFTEGFQDASGNPLADDSMKLLLNTLLPKLRFRSDDETEITLATNDLSEGELLEEELNSQLNSQLKKTMKEEVLELRNRPILPTSLNATSFSLEQGIQSQSNLPTIGR